MSRVYRQRSGHKKAEETLETMRTSDEKKHRYEGKQDDDDDDHRWGDMYDRIKIKAGKETDRGGGTQREKYKVKSSDGKKHRENDTKKENQRGKKIEINGSKGEKDQSKVTKLF